MTASVKPLRNFGTKNRLDALRVQLMAGEMSVRIGQRIREARLAMHLNQRELALKINEAAEADGSATPIDNQRVSDWERGVNKPSERYMALLATALEKRVSWFYETDRTDGATPDPFAGQSVTREDIEAIHGDLGANRKLLEAIAGYVERQEGILESIERLLKKQDKILTEIQRAARGLPTDDAITALRQELEAQEERDRAAAKRQPATSAEAGRARRRRASGK